MYETMVYWENALTLTDQPQFVLDWARQWQAPEKVVFAESNMSIKMTLGFSHAKPRSPSISNRQPVGGHL